MDRRARAYWLRGEAREGYRVEADMRCADSLRGQERSGRIWNAAVREWKRTEIGVCEQWTDWVWDGVVGVMGGARHGTAATSTRDETGLGSER